jgi:adenylate cyclase class 2
MEKDTGRHRKFIPRRIRSCRAGEHLKLRAHSVAVISPGFAPGWLPSALSAPGDKVCLYTFLEMPKPEHSEEIEIKLRIPDIIALRNLLKRLRAREVTPRTHESNTLFDTPKGDLRRRGRLIRIRVERLVKKSVKKRRNERESAILTYKGPTLPSKKGAKKGKSSKIRAPFKIREELETSVASVGQTVSILRALGLRPAFRYEKFRTTYALPGVRNLKVELDETPVGTYLELEGTIAGIDRGARRLGYTRQDYLTVTYGSLYFDDCQRSGRKPANMLFQPTKKSR